MNARLLLWFLLLSMLPWEQARAQSAEPSPEELEEIERALAQDLQQPKQEPPPPPPSILSPTAGFGLQSLNPEISFIADVALAAFSTRENLQTGAHDPSKNGFNLQQLEMAVGGSVDPFFRFDANIVFAQFGVEVEEVYATTLSLPAQLQVRAGQFLTRFGRLNSTHPHSWVFVDQPFPLGRLFGGEGNRGLGAELSWLAPLPWYVELVGSVTDAVGASTARSFFGAQDLGVSGPFDFQFTGVVKQFYEVSDAWSVFWGLSATTGPNPTGHRNRSEVFASDLYVKYRPLGDERERSFWALQAEVFYRRRQVPGDVLDDWSGYSYLLYRLNQQWETGVRYEVGTPAVRRDGSVGGDYLDPEWTSSRHRVSGQLTFFPTEFSRLRLQGSIDVPTFRDTPTYAGFIAFEFNVGAHGAHTF